jgi:membrane protein DedA with SNARE-associated domain
MRIGTRILKQIAAWKWRILLVYLVLLGLSYFVRWQRVAETVESETCVFSVPAIYRDEVTNQTVSLAYRDYQSAATANAPVVVLLHGSPGNHRDFVSLAPAVAKHYRVITPDLPGFGASSHVIPDYSNRAHARYVLELLDQLQVRQAHFVGFSMGGGVALALFPDENHFYVFSGPWRQASVALDFLARVDKGQAQVKANADPQRLVLSLEPFNPSAAISEAMGPTALLLFVLLALATLITEDLTCVWAGVLAAEGRIDFALATIACLVGIVIGDVLLFLAGRLFGRALLRRAPLNWFLRESEVKRCSAWFQRRGMLAIFVSRFLPGTRLPTYFAAGLLDTNLIKFTLYFITAAVVWTPLLVGASMLVGREVIESALMTQQSVSLRIATTALVVFVVLRLLLRLSSFRGRRLLVARWRRLTRWEFWPPWVFYPPVVLYVIYLGLKYRSPTLFTCANPAIEESGFTGESKSKILQSLVRNSSSFVGTSRLIAGSLSHHARVESAHAFMREHVNGFPVVLKPDAGERGAGVAVIRSETELSAYLNSHVNVIIQEYVGGFEFGVFYYRYPDRQTGRIFSITRKQFPCVTGDGTHSLENLILKDDRAVCMAHVYFDAQRDRLWSVPEKDEPVQLIEIGTHCRGCIFLDGDEIKTEALEVAIDRVARGFDGFYFGRFDIRTPSLADFKQGINFKVVELNGVTSEATHIYDPRISLANAYRILFQQWRIAFEIGAQNRKQGIKPVTLRTLASLLIQKWRRRVETSSDESPLVELNSEYASELPQEL